MPVPSAESFVVAVHGGCGHYAPDQFRARELAAYRCGLERALEAAGTVLGADGTALEAVERAVAAMEDDDVFNAGRGAVLNAGGVVELDAAIMDGATLDAGAVAGLTTTRNPIAAARAVMTHSPHVLLHGADADVFARRRGLAQVENRYFVTAKRRRQLADVQARGDEFGIAGCGTVGAVARDRAGRLAAATSTGGMINKLAGRVSDSAVIGAGVYASLRSCAVAASGHGEFFVRLAAAKDIASRIEYGGQGLAEAVRDVVHGSLAALGGDGGVIAVDAGGAVAIDMNAAGMFCGVLRDGGAPETAVFAADARAMAARCGS